MRNKKNYVSLLFVLSCFFCFSFPVQANTKVLDSSGEFMNEVQKNWEGDYYDKMVLDKDSQTIEKDEQKTSFSKEFRVSEEKAESITQSEKTVEKFLDKKEGEYEVNTNKEGDIVITSPYQMKRLIVNTILKNTYGASSVYYDKDFNQTFLQFKTEEETKEACEEINSHYKKTMAFPDSLTSVCKNDGFATKSINEPKGIQSWGIKKMGLDVLKENIPEEYKKNEVKVAIIDTGYNPNNYIMNGRKALNESKAFRPDKKNTLLDEIGHGCHVTGTIVEGTSDNVKLLVLPVFDSDEETSISCICEALKYAIKQKSNVINMSIGAIFDECNEKKEGGVMDNIISKARNDDIVIVVAAGNDAVPVKYFYPAQSHKVITVAAVNPSLERAEYSNYGSEIDFSAPGDAIWGAAPKGKYSLAQLSGTSMSAPHLTAGVAMIQTKNPNMSFQTVYNTLKQYSKDLGKVGKDTYYGWGCPILKDFYASKEPVNNATKQHPAKVSLHSIKPLKGKKIQLSWTKNPGADAYVVSWKAQKGAHVYRKAKTVTNSNTTSCTLTIPSMDSFINYQVEVYDNGYYSGPSNVQSILVLNKPTLQLKKKNRTITAISVPKTNMKGGKLKCEFLFSKNKNFKKCVKMKGQLKSNKSKSFYESILKNFKKNKKYYVKARLVFTKGNKKYYSDYSKVKTFKFK